MVGGGIASLVAAVHLILEADVPAKNIHILEATKKPGGALNAVNDGSTGYSIRGARKLNFTYHCLYDTLAKVPSGSDGRTILQEISSFNKYFNSHGHNKIPNPARLVGSLDTGPEIVDASRLNLEEGDKVRLLELIMQNVQEKDEPDKEIQRYFEPPFFESIFWDMWSSMYSFQPWHSLKEFRRYLHRFLHEFPKLHNFAGVERTPMNDFESVILPIEKYLKELGVQFKYGVVVKKVIFDDRSGDDICVSGLKFLETYENQDHTISIRPQDICLITLGGVMSGCLSGSNEKAPPQMRSQTEVDKDPGPAWKFWIGLADPTQNRHAEAFGRPQNFFSRISKSSWLSFTITLRDTDFMKRLGEWTRTERDSYPLITFRDSPWLISFTVPNQPYFRGQAQDKVIIWGYGLYPDQDGVYVRKPMTQCCGREIFAELLGHIQFPLHPFLEQSTTIPVFMPFVGSPFLTRNRGDRPKVVPERSTNLGLMGQFVEIDRDVTFTMEYSARSAQTAVFTLMGLDRKPHTVFRGDHSVQVLGEALKAIMS